MQTSHSSMLWLLENGDRGVYNPVTSGCKYCYIFGKEQKMPLALDNPRWKELESCYGTSESVVALLNQAYSDGVSLELINELINSIRHQGDTSTAMYAVAPHLIVLAKITDTDNAFLLLTQVGLIYAYSDAPESAYCPEFLREEFLGSAQIAARQLASLLPDKNDFYDFTYGVAALAGFVGQHAFGRLLTGFDCFEGKLYHSAIDEPFPTDS